MSDLLTLNWTWRLWSFTRCINGQLWTKDKAKCPTVVDAMAFLIVLNAEATITNQTWNCQCLTQRIHYLVFYWVFKRQKLIIKPTCGRWNDVFSLQGRGTYLEMFSGRRWLSLSPAPTSELWPTATFTWSNGTPCRRCWSSTRRSPTTSQEICC